MGIRLAGLTVEHSPAPLGIDVRPRFGWQVEGDGEPVQVLGWRLDVLSAPGDPLWTKEDASGAPGVDVEYDGPELRSLTRYDWRVAVRTDRGDTVAESTFTTGVLDGNWRGAGWIAHPSADGAAPLLRREFTVSRMPESALLVVAAGGYARPELNGEELPGFTLAPDFTDYDVTAQYLVTDVTDRLVPGANALGVELGRGFYGMSSASTWNWETAPWHDDPCVRILLVADGEVLLRTDDEWRAIDGPTRYDDLYGGEDFDARADRPGFSRAGYGDRDWRPASRARGPRGRAVNRRQQPVAVAERFAPEYVEQTAPGRWLFRFPRVIAGGVRMQLAGAPGEVVTVSAGEKLRADGRPDADDPAGYYAGRFQECRITLAGEPLEWVQRFGYQGFRFVEVTALNRPHVEAELVHTAVARTGIFHSSSPLLNRLHELTVATVLNNLHGLPTDTPMYEKNGWTGDGMLGAEFMLLNLDCQELLAKWAADIAASRHGSGAPEVIAPHGGWTMDWTPAPTWHASLLFVPWELYRQRGDVRVLADTWGDASAYLEFELARWPDRIADTTLGDWVSPDADPGGGNAPEDTRIAASAFVIACLDIAARTAGVLGLDGRRFADEAARWRIRFVETFFAPQDARVAGRGDAGFRQTHQVLALAFDLLPPEHRQAVADTLAREIAENGHRLNTGALGTKYLLPQLTRFGHAGTALAVAEQTGYPSWGHWVELGATSLWEHWSPDARSHGHYFLGTIDDWLYSGVAGLSPASAGWRSIRIAPAVLELESARASVLTPLGRAAVSWRRTGQTVEFDVEVPVGATATVHLAEEHWAVTSGAHRFVGAIPAHPGSAQSSTVEAPAAGR